LRRRSGDKIIHLEDGRTEDVELHVSGYSKIPFVDTFEMFWVRRVEWDGFQYPVGMSDEPTDNETIKVIRDCANRHRIVPDAYLSRQRTLRQTDRHTLEDQGAIFLVLEERPSD
jgi:hypothetical protein